MDQLSPEEVTLLQNIQSLVEQLKQLSGGAASASPDTAPVQAAQDTPSDQEPDADDVARKAAIAKAIADAGTADGSTASDTAEQIIADIPDEALENVDEVAKTQLRALVKKGKIVIGTPASVKKTNDRIANIAKSVSALAKVVKSVMDDQEETMDAVKGILEGIGVADDVKKSFQSRQAAQMQVQKSQPIMGLNADQKDLLALIAAGAATVQKSAAVEPGVGSTDAEVAADRGAAVRKDLNGAMGQIFARR